MTLLTVALCLGGAVDVVWVAELVVGGGVCGVGGGVWVVACLGPAAITSRMSSGQNFCCAPSTGKPTDIANRLRSLTLRM